MTLMSPPAVHGEPRCSLVVPVYRNAATLPALLDAIGTMVAAIGEPIEAVFVIDGSPDDSEELLREELRRVSFPSQLIVHSRNFGSFAAIRTGLEHAQGSAIAVMAADLQEPPELVEAFFRSLLADEADVVVGKRTGRADPLGSRIAANLFWRMYKRFVQPDIPDGGIDVFGCTAAVRDALLRFDETNSALVGQLVWVGFRRLEIPYERRERADGEKSGWTFKSKWRYMSNSIFAFTDLPIRILLTVGMLGIVLTLAAAATVLGLRLAGVVDVRGYTPLMLAVLFVGALNLFAMGIVGAYVWRAYENTKHRPLALSRTAERQSRETYGGTVRAPHGHL